MHPIPGTITAVRFISDRDPGDEQPETLSAPRLTPEQWATLIELAEALPTVLNDWLTVDEHAVLDVIRKSAV